MSYRFPDMHARLARECVLRPPPPQGVYAACIHACIWVRMHAIAREVCLLRKESYKGKCAERTGQSRQAPPRAVAARAEAAGLHWHPESAAVIGLDFAGDEIRRELS